MNKIILVYIFSIALTNARSQSEFLINDLSDKYYAKLTIDKDGNGLASILRKGDNVSLLKVEGGQFDFGLKPGQKTMKYKDQSVVVYDDFNFDGVKDLGIQEFISSKGPAYMVFLFKDNAFKKDDVFTDIIQASQGNYTLDPVKKTISTTSSGGCCIHASALYAVKDGKPSEVKYSEEEITEAFTTVTTREWKEGKKTETTDKTLMFSDEPVMSFLLSSNKKKVMLFSTNDRSLMYALVKGNNKVEFNFPAMEGNEGQDFTLSASRNELIFRNASAEYTVYQKVVAGKIGAVGIIVRTGGKEYDLKGDIATLKGKLGGVMEMENVAK